MNPQVACSNVDVDYVIVRTTANSSGEFCEPISSVSAPNFVGKTVTSTTTKPKADNQGLYCISARIMIIPCDIISSVWPCEYC